MVRNRKLIFLTAAVVFIWGMIVYRIYDQLNHDPATTSFTKRFISDTVSVNTFELNLSYPDPFLKPKAPPRTIVAKAKVKSQPKAQTVVQHVVDWQRVAYAGFIVNATRRTKTATLRIDNTDVFLKEGEEHDGFKVLSIFSDSVLMDYDGARQFVRKKQK